MVPHYPTADLACLNSAVKDRVPRRVPPMAGNLQAWVTVLSGEVQHSLSSNQPSGNSEIRIAGESYVIRCLGADLQESGMKPISGELP